MKKFFLLAAIIPLAVSVVAQSDTTAISNTGVAQFPNYHPSGAFPLNTAFNSSRHANHRFVLQKQGI
jgi:hypothetical protein